jgi:hypothetical protein
MNHKTFISLALSVLMATNVATASLYIDDEAPQSSLDTCLAEVSANADYAGASNVMHYVESKPRSVSGYTVSIRTLVYDGETVIHEYAARCAIDRQDDIRFFRMRDRVAD